MSHKIEVVDGNVCIHIGTTPVADLYRHIEVLTIDEARSLVADIAAAIESLEQPVRIDRWLTPADIEKYGDRWMWHSDQWAVGQAHQFTAFCSTRVVMIRGSSDYFSEMFSKGDYFTPIKGDK